MPEVRREFEFDCPACGGRLWIPIQGRRLPVECGHCRQTSIAPWFHARPGERPPSRASRAGGRGRPVARTFTAGDLRRSLHHLMLGCRRPYVPPPALSPRARRYFDFYCGACGALQWAQVYEIATQRPCGACDALMIIPAPEAPGGPHAGDPPWPVAGPTAAIPPTAGRLPVTGGLLYCPQCGRPVDGADRTRRAPSWCGACGLWF